MFDRLFDIFGFGISEEIELNELIMQVDEIDLIRIVIEKIIDVIFDVL